MKKTIFSIGLCLTLLLSGCAQRGNKSPEYPSITQPDKTSSFSQSEKIPVSPFAVKQADWSGIQGKTKSVYPAGGSKVLVFADQITLYDLASGKIVANTENAALKYPRVWMLDSGYAIVGETVSESSSVGLAQGDSGP